MNNYEYTGKTSEPDLSAVQSDIDSSAMTDKSYEGCSWCETTETLTIHMTNELSSGDETILDGIAAGY